MDHRSITQVLVEATGLPETSVQIELNRIIEKSGYDKDNISLEEIRNVMAEYLQDVILQAKACY